MAGIDYPRTLAEFNAWFPDEAACLAYLARLRWPDGFVCLYCGSTKSWQLARPRKLRCAGCRREISITAGTVFADSHLPLMSWFAAAWYVTSQKPGASALGLQRVLGLGSYRTAWAMLHKLRRAMVRAGRDQLAGEIEVDETTIGASQPGSLGRGTFASKAIVAIAVEALPRGTCGRVRLARIPDCSKPVLTGFVVARHPPRRNPAAPARLLPRRVHLPLQPQKIPPPRPPLPPAARAGRAGRPRTDPRPRRRATMNQGAICA